ncbi:helicase-related protein [Egicoccus sp. AB-alg6-2]|uniref:helicase-related protein n=1 Tax=Egicoccus sp. AB-alg6-2 TaxID=3242692 RepID=UPI00359DC76F
MMDWLPQADERIVAREQLVLVVRADRLGEDAAQLFVQLPDGSLDRVTMTREEVLAGRSAVAGRSADPQRTLAALHGLWMRSAAEQMRSGALATKPLRPFAHQDEAVDRMLAQPQLRFLLGDEPGTGKTIMSGLYIVEARRKMLLQGRALIVVPAHLVPKWEREMLAYFGIEVGVVTSEVGRDLRPLRGDVDTWLVSVDLFTYNMDVRAKLAGSHASWSLTIFDEAHRLTPTSQLLGAAQQVVGRSRHVLLLTATPHRGKEDFFRELMHLLDPAVYAVDTDQPCVPSSAHFLRRMKEDLKDAEGNPLFPERLSETVPTTLRVDEAALYRDVMGYVEAYYPHALTIARIIYGKRAASSTAALRATLERRREFVKGLKAARGRGTFDPRFVAALTGELAEVGLVEDDERWADAEQVLVGSDTTDKQGELQAIDGLLTSIDRVEAAGPPTKWHQLANRAEQHGVRPGNDQLLVFTEFTDTATWLVEQFHNAGFTAELLSGGVGHKERDLLQRRFLARDFQVLVSTDAGGEGIDLQSANVMFNWDVPWSMVRLEQRMGRLHRIGQQRPVFVYHLVSPDTAEGRVQEVMLDNIAAASTSLSGRMYDLMDATAARLGFDLAALLVRAVEGRADREDVPDSEHWERAAAEIADNDLRLTQQTNLDLAQRRLQDDVLEQINPVHVRRFLETVAAWQDWKVTNGPHDGIYVLDASPRSLPEFMGGKQIKLVATHGKPVADAISAGAVGLTDQVTVFGPTEPALAELSEMAVDEGMLDLTSPEPPVLVDTESYTPYVLGVYETTITTETDTGRTSRRLPFLVRLSGPGEAVVPDWPSVLRLSAAAPSSDPGELTPGGRVDLNDAAMRHVKHVAEERRALRVAWAQETRNAMEDGYLRYQQEISNRPDDKRAELLAAYQRRMQTRHAELDRMLIVDAAPPQLIGAIRVSAGMTVDDPALRENGEKVAIGEAIKELGRNDFQVHDMQTAGVGYDLKAVNHPVQPPRCVEVKSLLDGLDGVTLEQSEWTQAQQLGDAYWLYVVIGCRSGSTPQIAVRLQNPAAVLANTPEGHQRFRINVSQLRPFAEKA